jgi:hypothetical protein
MAVALTVLNMSDLPLAPTKVGERGPGGGSADAPDWYHFLLAH